MNEVPCMVKSAAASGPTEHACISYPWNPFPPRRARPGPGPHTGPTEHACNVTAARTCPAPHTSPIRKRTLLGHYRRPMPRVPGGPREVVVFSWARYPCRSRSSGRDYGKVTPAILHGTASPECDRDLVQGLLGVVATHRPYTDTSLMRNHPPPLGPP
jgi:hypothetical protein